MRARKSIAASPQPHLGGVPPFSLATRSALASPKGLAGKAHRQDRGPHLGAGLYSNSRMTRSVYLKTVSSCSTRLGLRTACSPSSTTLRASVSAAAPKVSYASSVSSSAK